MPEARLRPAGRVRFSLTPFGAGLSTLFFPGVVVALASHDVMLVAVALGAGMLLALDAAAGRHVLSSVDLAASGPGHAATGREVDLRVEVATARPVQLSVASARGGGASLVDAPGRVALPVPTGSRGLLARVGLRLRTSAPLGLVVASRPAMAELSRPVAVVPAAAAGPERTGQPAGVGGLHGHDEPVGIRPYQQGDSPREIHWPTVARTGVLQVRDRRRSDEVGPVDLVVVVPEGPSSTADEVVAWGRHEAERILAGGGTVHLRTVEADVASAPVDPGESSGGRRWATAVVRSADELAEGLARAVPGLPDREPDLPAGRRPVLVVDQRGARWVSVS